MAHFNFSSGRKALTAFSLASPLAMVNPIRLAQRIVIPLETSSLQIQWRSLRMGTAIKWLNSQRINRIRTICRTSRLNDAISRSGTG